LFEYVYADLCEYVFTVGLVLVS